MMDLFNRDDRSASPKRHRPKTGFKKIKSRQSMLWLLPVPIFGTMGFFFIIFGIINVSTSKSGTSKVTVTTGVILLISGGIMLGLSFFFLCSSPRSGCASSRPTEDEVVSIAFPRDTQASFDIIPSSAPPVEEDFFQLSPVPSRRDTFYPLVSHGQGQQLPYPYGRFDPTAPEVPLYPCWVPQTSMPTLQQMSPESEAVIRLAILNNPQIPLSLILSSGLTVQPRVSI
ncbi:uncharacterized protein LOC135224946 [Macrobrachium nipponense]|uniref:uncharacterized protein LOC135224946 n=1 Tax=Macrobrachium nipponense TaxID=159736 RepID=UPI0030C7B3D8